MPRAPRSLAVALAATLLPLTVLGATSTAAAHETATGSCQQVSVPVPALAGEGVEIAGQLCVPRQLRSHTLQVLVPGIPFDGRYWDSAGGAGRASYVDRATDEGIATLALDRLGTGASSRPAAAEVTIEAQVEALAAVVAAARSHEAGWGPFDGVVTVGFSVGSAVVIEHAATRKGVDGVVVTGFAHSAGPAAAQFGTVIVPAALDPVTAATNPPADYLTLTAGAGDLFGFDPRTSSERTRRAAESQKTTFTGAEGEGFGRVQADRSLSQAIGVPVLVVLGEADPLFCTAGCPEAAQEAAAYAPGGDVQVVTVPRTAHILNLHRTAPMTHRAVLRWFDRRFAS